MLKNSLINARVWFDNVKIRLATALLLMLGNLPGAHAAGGWFDTLNELGENMKQARTPLMLIFGTIGVVAVGAGIMIIKNVNDPKKQQQNHGRGAMAGVIYIFAGVCLIGLAIVIKKSGDTVGVQTEV